MSSSSNESAVFEAGVIGACALMTLFGIAVIAATVIFEAELVPHSTGIAAGIMAVLAVVGALLGTGAARVAGSR